MASVNEAYEVLSNSGPFGFALRPLRSSCPLQNSARATTPVTTRTTRLADNRDPAEQGASRAGIHSRSSSKVSAGAVASSFTSSTRTATERAPMREAGARTCIVSEGTGMDPPISHRFCAVESCVGRPPRTQFRETSARRTCAATLTTSPRGLVRNLVRTFMLSRPHRLTEVPGPSSCRSDPFIVLSQRTT
jgi:hypothetical protein